MLMTLVHRLSASTPKLADSQRAALLMAANAPYQPRLPKVVEMVPMARTALRGLSATTTAAVSAGPMIVGQQLVAPTPKRARRGETDSGPAPGLTSAPSPTELVGALDPSIDPGAPPPPPAVRREQRRAALAGSATAVALGVLLQRAVNHGARREGALGELGRATGTQLAIGGASGIIVVATESALGRNDRQLMGARGPAVLLGGLVAIGQSRALRRAMGVLTLPSSPYSTHRPS